MGHASASGSVNATTGIKTSGEEVRTLTTRDAVSLIRRKKPLFFNVAGDRVALMALEDSSKDMHAGTWFLSGGVAVILTNVPDELAAEFVLHELNEIAIVKAISNVSEEALNFEPAVQHVTHYLGASSLGQYNALELCDGNPHSPIRHHIRSDVLPTI